VCVCMCVYAFVCVCRCLVSNERERRCSVTLVSGLRPQRVIDVLVKEHLWQVTAPPYYRVFLRCYCVSALLHCVIYHARVCAFIHVGFVLGGNSDKETRATSQVPLLACIALLFFIVFFSVCRFVGFCASLCISSMRYTIQCCSLLTMLSLSTSSIRLCVSSLSVRLRSRL
jgi:hypothetical protein